MCISNIELVSPLKLGLSYSTDVHQFIRILCNEIVSQTEILHSFLMLIESSLSSG